jgi:hypothetical protein
MPLGCGYTRLSKKREQLVLTVNRSALSEPSFKKPALFWGWHKDSYWCRRIGCGIVGLGSGHGAGHPEAVETLNCQVCISRPPGLCRIDREDEPFLRAVFKNHQSQFLVEA